MEQDWQTVTISRPSTAVDSLRQSGQSGQIRQGSGIQERAGVQKNTGAHFAKLEEKEVGKLKTLTPESRQAIIQSRLLLKLTQVQLDQRLAFPSNTIREIEAGRLTPAGSQLNRLNQVLRLNPGLKLA